MRQSGLKPVGAVHSDAESVPKKVAVRDLREFLRGKRCIKQDARPLPPQDMVAAGGAQPQRRLSLYADHPEKRITIEFFRLHKGWNNIVLTGLL